jgi:hypothetical protein
MRREIRREAQRAPGDPPARERGERKTHERGFTLSRLAVLVSCEHKNPRGLRANRPLDQTVNAAKDLEAALKSAIAAAASAEHFAKTVNYAVHFGSDDLTQMAATLLEEYEDLGDCVSGTTLNDAEHDLDDAGATPALMGVRR